jgi:hypothetical protein
MLKLFRKFRQRLLTGNKVTNYLLYAIGEIVLVVIGILIALSINNANQDRITREKEQAYLKGLKSEFAASRHKLENLMEVNRQNYEGAKQLLSLLSEDSPTYNEVQLSRLLFASFAYEIAYNPNNSLLNEMINSGSLKDISNPKLRIYLTTWESITESVRVQEADLRTQRENVRNLFRGERGSTRTIFDHAGVSSDVIGLSPHEENDSNIDLMKSREFENNVLLFILTGISAETAHYDPLMNEITAILALIEAEIG